MSTLEELGWITEQLRELAVPVDTLHQDPANARLHSERNLKAIASSLNRFGQRKPIVVQRESRTVIAGNGTLEAACSLDWSHVAAVFVDDDPSTATGYAIADNRTAELAEWDVDALLEQVKALDLEYPELAACTGFTPEDLDALLDSVNGDLDNKYTRKIVTPVYEPRGEPPAVAHLYDETQSTELVEEIMAADIPVEIKTFLEVAAQRHTSFHFGRIADYYAHASSEVQSLMERSALVIIDFEQAIERGFVKLNESMLERVGQEHPGEE